MRRKISGQVECLLGAGGSERELKIYYQHIFVRAFVIKYITFLRRQIDVTRKRVKCIIVVK